MAKRANRRGPGPDEVQGRVYEDAGHNKHQLATIEGQAHECGDMSLYLTCTCGLEGVYMVENGGCGKTHHISAGAPWLDPFHVNLLLMDTSQATGPLATRNGTSPPPQCLWS